MVISVNRVAVFGTGLRRLGLLFWLGEQTELDDPDGCLGAVGDPELGDDAVDVGLDRGEADQQFA